MLKRTHVVKVVVIAMMVIFVLVLSAWVFGSNPVEENPDCGKQIQSSQSVGAFYGDLLCGQVPVE